MMRTQIHRIEIRDVLRRILSVILRPVREEEASGKLNVDGRMMQDRRPVTYDAGFCPARLRLLLPFISSPFGAVLSLSLSLSSTTVH